MTYFALLFFDFVTCPCSFRTKRDDNLFIYDDDEELIPSEHACHAQSGLHSEHCLPVML